MFKSRYNRISLFDEIRRPEDSLKFLQDHNILRKTARCEKCLSVCSAPEHRSDRNYIYFSCSKCKSQESITKHTFLYNKNINLRTFILFVYSFTMMQGLSISQIIHEVIEIYSLMEYWNIRLTNGRDLFA